MFDSLYDKPTEYEIYKTPKEKLFTYTNNFYYPLTVSITILLFLLLPFLKFFISIIFVPLFFLLILKGLFFRAIIWLLITIPMTVSIGATAKLGEYALQEYEWLHYWWVSLTPLNPIAWFIIILMINFGITIYYMSLIPKWRKTKIIKKGCTKLANISADSSDEALALFADNEYE